MSTRPAFESLHPSEVNAVRQHPSKMSLRILFSITACSLALPCSRTRQGEGKERARQGCERAERATRGTRSQACGRGRCEGGSGARAHTSET